MDIQLWLQLFPKAIFLVPSSDGLVSSGNARDEPKRDCANITTRSECTQVIAANAVQGVMHVL